jgi:hypothetical protein
MKSSSFQTYDRAVQTLPLSNRNFIQVLGLVTGVVTDLPCTHYPTRSEVPILSAGPRAVYILTL